MFNPFIPFRYEYFERFEKAGTHYYVTQTHERARDHFVNEAYTPILITEYEDKGLAMGHLRAVKADRFGALIDTKNPKHREKLVGMMSADSAYRLYWSVVEDKEKVATRLNQKYKDAIRRYLQTNTDWRIAADERIKPKLEVIFGELFITIKHGSKQLRIKFEEIERM